MITPCTITNFLSVFTATILALVTTITTAEVALTAIDYSDGSHALQGYLALPKSLPAPAVVIILPDWNGVNEYEKKRASMMASDLGYAAFAADIYGVDLHDVTEISEKRRLADLYRNDKSLFISRIQAAVDVMKDREGDYIGPVGVIGYCLGGTGVLLYALSGADDAAALVSVHGGLMNFEVGPSVKPKLLVLSGGEDDTATNIRKLEMKLDTAEATWEITRYSGIKHGFTTFGSPKYDAWADARSWNSMASFLLEAFGIEQFESGKLAAPSTIEINYDDVDGTALRGYLSLPVTNTPPDDKGRLVRAVIIFPDWDGVNEYEKLRATMLSDAGYIAFAADIYGADLQENLTLTQKKELATKYRTNSTLYVQRMQLAIDTVLSNVEDVDLVGRIAIIGYCFGGTGVVQYAFSGATDAEVAVAFHGGLTDLPPAESKIHARVVVLSGGMDDAHGNQTELEEELDGGGEAGWEITRYAGVKHGFTNWAGTGYDLLADVRSWEEMMTIFDDIKQISTLSPAPATTSSAPKPETESKTTPSADKSSPTTESTSSPTQQPSASKSKELASSASLVSNVWIFPALCIIAALV